jgi:general secretion pathway protein E
MTTCDAATALLAFDTDAFGASLAQSSIISEHDWRIAHEVARQQGQTPLRALLELGLISEDALANALARALAVDRWTDEDESRAISDAAPRRFMESASLLLLEANSEQEPRALHLVCADPSEVDSLRSLLGALDAPFSLAVGANKDVQQFLRRQSEEQAIGSHEGEAGAMDVSVELSQLRDMASEAPVIRFFNQAVERAMELGASDLHVERYDHRTSLRVRVDGLLIEQPAPPPNMYEALICRIKIMASLDIAERRLPQDGRIRMRLRGRMVDLRVSLVPTTYGQDAAIRIQDRQALAEVTLAGLGFGERQERWLRATAQKSHGILLITGPTGSGKTTTLYALLRTLRSAERKIVTVEDPVEFAMEGVNQIQVNPAIGLTFGNTLRHILRHDPDVILIGEIRDHETAEMAFQAALTGHMVLSTLHTNDVPGTFVRLIDMGVEPYLVNAAVEGVSAQRLLRRVCDACANAPDRRDSCARCGGIGYRGRVALMEHSGVTPALKKAIVEGADERRLREVLVEGGFQTTRAHAKQLIEQGVTDEAEVARVLGAGGPVETLGADDA